MQHFIRGIDRLYYIRDNNIPILFINISMEFDNTQCNTQLINSIHNYGFNNMKILSIYKSTDIHELELLHTCDNNIIYKMHSDGLYSTNDDIIVKDIILKHFNINNLLTKYDFPK